MFSPVLIGLTLSGASQRIADERSANQKRRAPANVAGTFASWTGANTPQRGLTPAQIELLRSLATSSTTTRFRRPSPACSHMGCARRAHGSARAELGWVLAATPRTRLPCHLRLHGGRGEGVGGLDRVRGRHRQAGSGLLRCRRRSPQPRQDRRRDLPDVHDELTNILGMGWWNQLTPPPETPGKVGGPRATGARRTLR
jgi:hypothetical protein